MQSSTYRRDNSYISLGERRGKSDLARFSLDLSWARAVSDSARSRAYPSPPMSGSPPLPPRRNPESSDRGHGSYGSTRQDVFRGDQISQAELAEQSRGPPLRAYQDPLPPASYGSYRMEDIPPHLQYQPQRQQMPQQQHQHHHPAYPQQPPPPFSAPDRRPTGESTEYSPKAQRKTKGHVASACVPCKRAHLRCDAQRPCSRCLSNGKEDTCVDVQHKKRGRPRLRDERESRYEALGPNYPPPPEAVMRRPLSYTPSEAQTATTFGDSIHRTGSYRVIKSQGGPPMGGSMAPRYLEHASPADANLYVGAMPPRPRMMAPEPVCAYLTMEMQIAKATQGFGETIGVQSVVARKFHDIVSANDRDKVFRLQRVFEDERRDKESNYLPPIYLKFEEDRVIQSVGFGPEEMGQFRSNQQDMFTFQGPDGQQRTFQVRFGLAKKESTYFIVCLLNLPATPQTFSQPSSSPYSRESYSRESQYSYQTPQQVFTQPGASPFMSNPSFGDRGDVYRTPGPLGPTISPSTNMPPFAQAPPRLDYPQGQNPYQTPHSELPQAQPLAPRQHDLQLPPIRDQRAEGSRSDLRGRDNQSGRVDIGGLLENPGMGRKGH